MSLRVSSKTVVAALVLGVLNVPAVLSGYLFILWIPTTIIGAVIALRIRARLSGRPILRAAVVGLNGLGLLGVVGWAIYFAVTEL